MAVQRLEQSSYVSMRDVEQSVHLEAKLKKDDTFHFQHLVLHELVLMRIRHLNFDRHSLTLKHLTHSIFTLKIQSQTDETSYVLLRVSSDLHAKNRAPITTSLKSQSSSPTRLQKQLATADATTAVETGIFSDSPALKIISVIRYMAPLSCSMVKPWSWDGDGRKRSSRKPSPSESAWQTNLAAYSSFVMPTFYSASTKLCRVPPQSFILQQSNRKFGHYIFCHVPSRLKELNKDLVVNSKQAMLIILGLKYRRFMFVAEAKSEVQPFETKYPCIVCFQRVRKPVSCLRCGQVMCHSHVKKIHNRCPYCRLEPFEYKIDKFLDGLAQVDKKKEEDFLISTATFNCLVPGCDFKGRYHKMDLHRRRQHRHENLREIIFPEQRQEAMRKRALIDLLKKIQDQSKELQTIRKMALVLHKKGGEIIPINLVEDMIRHIWTCRHADCKKIFIEENMSFIGKEGKEISSCPKAQTLMRFY